MSTFRFVFRRFLRDRKGSFATISALMGVVLIAALGGGGDVARQLWIVSLAQRATDAAVLAGAKEATSNSIAATQSAMSAIAAANMPSGLENVTFTSNIDVAGGIVTMTAKGSLKPYFLPLVSIDTLSISAKAVASIQQKQYADFYILLDTSESMNIAASEADRTQLEKISKASNGRPCAFACHIVEPSWGPLSVWEMNQRASGGPVTLRIDVARDAINNIVTKLLKLNAAPDSLKSIRIAASIFSDIYKKTSAPSTDADALSNAFKTPNGSSSDGSSNSHTNYPSVLAAFRSDLGQQQDGLSEKTAQKFAILITDGVRDNNIWFDHSGLGPLDPSLCQAIKTNGITLAVIEIKYLYRPEGIFNDRVAWYYQNISPSMQQCASSGYYFLATDVSQAEAKLVAATDALLAQQSRLVK